MKGKQGEGRAKVRKRQKKSDKVGKGGASEGKVGNKWCVENSVYNVYDVHSMHSVYCVLTMNTVCTQCVQCVQCVQYVQFLV